ncbi:MAG: hypothetical protein K6F05_02270 [Succinivibrio sp.]|nr:hypothetical protein [Succinivibrio sp.]
MTEINSLSLSGSHQINSNNIDKSHEAEYDEVKSNYLSRAEEDSLSGVSDDSQGRAPAESTLHKIGRWATKILGGLLVAAGVAAVIAAGVASVGLGGALVTAALFCSTTTAGIGLIYKSSEMEPSTQLFNRPDFEPGEISSETLKERLNWHERMSAMDDFLLMGDQKKRPKVQDKEIPVSRYDNFTDIYFEEMIK